MNKPVGLSKKSCQMKLILVTRELFVMRIFFEV
jgi:hypothetical protein